jgi:hypothetical protein
VGDNCGPDRTPRATNRRWVPGSDPGDPLFPVGGLLNRALIAVIRGWITVTAGRLLTKKHRKGITKKERKSRCRRKTQPS